MYDDEARQYLTKAFGTSKIGDCNKCNKRVYNKNRAIYVGQLSCGYNSCIMQVKLEMFEDAQKSQLQQKLGIKPSPMQSKISKLNFLGFDEHIVPPWLIMRSPTGGAYWFNTKLGLYGDKIYEDIYAYNDIIVCASEIKQLTTSIKQIAEMYSIECGNMNILYDFPNAVYKVNNNNMGYKTCENLGYAIFNIRDTDSGMKMTLIASKYGTRLVVPHIAMLNIDAYDGGLLITLGKIGEERRTIKTDAKLTIQRKAGDVVAFNI